MPDKKKNNYFCDMCELVCVCKKSCGCECDCGDDSEKNHVKSLTSKGPGGIVRK